MRPLNSPVLVPTAPEQVFVEGPALPPVSSPPSVSLQNIVDAYQRTLFDEPDPQPRRARARKPPRVLTPEQLAKREKNARRKAKAAFRRTRTLHAVECVTLNIDTAGISGWCINVRGRYRQSGEVDTRDDAAVRDVVQRALAASALEGLPCVLVLEKPFGKNLSVVAALGATRERWLVPWRSYAGRDKARVVLVSPPSWRSIVLGGRYASAPREECRAEERRVAPQVVGDERQLGEDECTACCISVWSSHALPVAAKCGKRVTEAAGIAGGPST